METLKLRLITLEAALKGFRTWGLGGGRGSWARLSSSPEHQRCPFQESESGEADPEVRSPGQTAPLSEGHSAHSGRFLTLKAASGAPKADTLSGNGNRATLNCFYNNSTNPCFSFSILLHFCGHSLIVPFESWFFLDCQCWFQWLHNHKSIRIFWKGVFLMCFATLLVRTHQTKLRISNCRPISGPGPAQPCRDTAHIWGEQPWPPSSAWREEEIISRKQQQNPDMSEQSDKMLKDLAWSWCWWWYLTKHMSHGVCSDANSIWHIVHAWGEIKSRYVSLTSLKDRQRQGPK